MILGVSVLLFGALVVYAGLHGQSVKDVLQGKPGTPLGKSLLPSDTFSSSSSGSSSGGGKGSIGGNLHLGRTDMGVDFSGSGPIPAVAPGTVTLAASSGTGWPGGALICWRLDQPITQDGITANYLYCAENISVKCHVGQHLNKGDTIGIARGFFPYIEYGFAAAPNGQTLSVAHGTQNTHPNHSDTPEGIAFRHYLGL